jgi:hypothetical protein
VRILTVLFLDGNTARDGDASRHDVCAEGPDRILLAPPKAGNHLVVKDDSTKGRRAQEMIQLKGRETAKVFRAHAYVRS